MQDVLMNLANLQMLQYCKEQGIDPSDSYVAKTDRGFVYGLKNNSDNRTFVQVTFTKNSVPRFWWGDAARERGMVG